MLKVALGHAEEIDTRAGVRMAIEQARRQLGTIPADAGIVLSGIEFDHKPMLEEVLAAFPGIRIVGCTTAGDFSSNMGLSEYTISLMLFASDTIEFNVGIGRGASDDPAEAASAAVREARAGLSRDETLCLVFPDSLCPTNAEVIEALNGELRRGCGLFGGASGRHTSKASEPLQFYQDEVLQDAVPLLMIAGDVPYSFSVSSGWDPVGRRTTVTEADGRVVHQIGDMRALDFYRDYLGDHSKPASEFPLAVYDDAGTRFYTRAPVRYDEEGASVTFAAPVPKGAVVQLCETTPALILEQVRTSVAEISAKHDGPPAAALVFSCNARKGILGTHAGEELHAVQGALAAGVPILGFYGFAEFGPLRRDDPCQLHNNTMITVLLGTRAEATAVAADEPATAAEPSSDSEAAATLARENAILQKKLERSEYHRRGLEQLRDSNAVLLKKINAEIEEARVSVAQEKEKAERLLLNTLPLEVAEELKRDGVVEPVFYPCASVLFTDFQDFAKVVPTMTPKQLVAELDFYFSAFDRVIERYNLEKLKTIGDAYMCAGGIPLERDGHIIDIVNAAWDIQLFMEGLKRKKAARGEPYWELRCGVHAGPLMAGVIGEKKFAYDIWGDAVNIASRLESSGEVGRVNISKEVYDVVRDRFECQHRGRVAIKNRGEIDMYFVTDRID
jgi:class 3 adenylate cyclase